MDAPQVIPLSARFRVPRRAPDERTAGSVAEAQPFESGYGLCRNWGLCGCQGYRGDGTQTCQSCGHGFGMHY